MADILMRLPREVLVLEGAMGTMLTRAGLEPGSCPELLNVAAPEMVAEVHRLYRVAGADVAMSNTFGGSRHKLANWGYEGRVAEFNRAGVRIAKRYGAPHVLGDVGPTGLVMEPLGPATFDEVFDIFAEQIAALAAEGPDAIFMETFTDIAEVRCAVLAARSVTDLPVFASVTFDVNGRMDLSGTDPATAAVILEAAGADAVGMNCGLGPEQMIPLVEQMAAATSLPVIVQPNAGMPTRAADGSTVFPGTPDDLYEAALRYYEAGAAAVGSCCGSTPAYTAAILDAVDHRPPVAHGPATTAGVVLAGPRRSARIGGPAPFAIIGERINPTGKKRLADSLREGSMAVVREFAAEQQTAGADLLDVNVGAAGVDATTALPQAVTALVGMTELPLVLDTTDAAALEAALRVYPGRALVNSVNGGAESLRTVLPLAAHYGAAVVVLALDDEGIPETAEGRLAVVDRVRAAAHAAGLSDADLVVDALVMTAATDADAPAVTLAATRGAAERGLATVLGVSNVSHGLPNRPALNAAFLAAAADAGLDAAIANPSDHIVAEAVRLVNVARGAGVAPDAHAQSAAAWERAYADALAIAAGGGSTAQPIEEGAGTERPATERLADAIARGDADGAPSIVDAVIAEGTPAGRVIGEVLTPAIQRLGDAYGRGEVFLPQLMVAAEAMKSAVARVKEQLPADAAGVSAGRVAFATVKGDIHSIGKDICVSLLESRGFDVRDLGVDVPAEDVAAAAGEADAVCLSALMTTTLPAMEATIERVREVAPGVPVLVGGAVVTADYAASIGAGYSADAPGCVEACLEAIAANGGPR